MLVSPDRLGWTYGGSLAADSQCRCQLLRNIHTHSWAHTYTHTPPTQTHISALLRICCSELWAVPTSCCPIISEPAPHEHRGNFGTSSISHHPSRPGASVQDERLVRSCQCPPTEREDGTADKGESGEHTASAKLCSKNSPARISFLPHVFVSVSSASCGFVSARFVCVVWCRRWQLARKSFPRVTGWVLCETEEYYLEARLTARPLAVSIFILPLCKSRTNHFFLILVRSQQDFCLWFHTVAVSLLKAGHIGRAYSEIQ